MKKRLLVLILAAAMLLSFVPMSTMTAAEEPYTFSLYYNYDWWTIHPWAEDEISKYWQEKFNIVIDQRKPDADAAAKLNLMVSSGDLPDVRVCRPGAPAGQQPHV